MYARILSCLSYQANRGRLAWARHRLSLDQYFGEIVSSMQDNYNEFWKTWVYSDSRKDGLCTVLINYKIEHTDCNENLPFICERGQFESVELITRRCKSLVVV